MKLAMISVVLFFIMKLIYGMPGDHYYNDYWHVFYYILNYTMMATLFRVAYLFSITKRRVWFFKLWSIYFAIMAASHVVYLFAESKNEMVQYGGELKEFVSIELYRKMNASSGFFGVGSICLMLVLSIKMGLMIYDHFRNKSYDPKNSRTAP